jgi:hypothetical protein
MGNAASCFASDSEKSAKPITKKNVPPLLDHNNPKKSDASNEFSNASSL